MAVDTQDIKPHTAPPPPPERTTHVAPPPPQDEEFLQTYVSKRSPGKEAKPDKEETSDEFLDRRVEASKTKKKADTSNADNLHKKAGGQEEPEEDHTDLDDTNDKSRVITPDIQPLIDGAGRLGDKVSSLHTVGGIGLLIVVLVFLLFVIVQVDDQGHTRAQQLWFMLNGKAHLDQRVPLAIPNASVQAAVQAGIQAAQANAVYTPPVNSSYRSYTTA
jgi:hypothetical protein